MLYAQRMDFCIYGCYWNCGHPRSITVDGELFTLTVEKVSDDASWPEDAVFWGYDDERRKLWTTPTSPGDITWTIGTT